MAEKIHADIKAEQSVIGSMLIDFGCAESVRSKLKTSDFYRNEHQLLFDALMTLRAEDRGNDLITVCDELRRLNDDPDQWQAAVYMDFCIQTAITASNVLIHCEIVKQKSILRRQQVIGAELHARLSKRSVDPADVRTWLAAELDRLNIETVSGPQKLDALLMGHFEYLAARKETQEGDSYTSGFTQLDEVIGGYGNDLFVVWKAKRGSGKTHNLIQTAVNCARSGRTAVVFSLDTPTRLMLNRLIAHISGIDSRRLMLPGEEDWPAIADAVGELWELPIYIYDRSGVPVADMAAQVKAIAAGGQRIGLVGIDYAELIGVDTTAGLSREQELSRISIGLRNICRDVQTTVLLLSQVNKEGKERYSEAIGNNCDLLVNWSDDHRVMVEKNRVGPGVSFQCTCDFATSRIAESYEALSSPPAATPYRRASVKRYDLEEN